MSYEELAIFAKVLGILLGALALYWATVKVIREMKQPSEDLKAAVKKHTEQLDNDNRRLNTLESDSKQTLLAISDLLQHTITGNDVAKLKSRKSDLDKYLINR